MEVVRTLVVWCPDWPVAALGLLDRPAAVLEANRVAAASPAARREGVRVGLRRRDAQARCPELVLAERDARREARAFEPVVAAVGAFSPLVELARPGSCALPTRGPSRYFGGDHALAAKVAAAVSEALAGRGRGRVGVADGPLAAALAARGRAPTGAADGSGAGGGNTAGDGAADGSGAVRVVPPGQSAAFLAPLPVTVLDQPELVGVLIRLGITTLGQLAALDPAAVLARFGWPGALARRLAAGLDERMPDLVRPGPELTASLELDPPLERVDQAAFAGKALAERFCARLAGEGLACLRVAVEAETEHGESLVRLWRAEGVLGPGPLTDRIRWQLDGWLAGPHAGRPTGGLSRLTLVPDQVVPARGRQLGFWGGETEGAERAARAAARLVGLLGPEGVLVPERRGGRSPREQLTLIPAAGVELGGRGPLPPPDRPWPGAPPPPLPAITPAEPAPAELVDEAGRPVGVSGRGEISAAPAWFSLGGAAPLAVLAWAGPWPVEERWWDPAARGRYARLQALTADGLARLLVLRAGRWLVEGVYD